MRRVAIAVLFVLCAGAVYADAVELSVVQRAVCGAPFIGSIGSVRIACVKAPEPWGKIDLFADGGVRLSETTETRLVGGLVGVSAGRRDDLVRLGAGYQYPGGFSVYVRGVIGHW